LSPERLCDVSLLGVCVAKGIAGRDACATPPLKARCFGIERAECIVFRDKRRSIGLQGAFLRACLLSFRRSSNPRVLGSFEPEQLPS
jgi:hypothetical protein